MKLVFAAAIAALALPLSAQAQTAPPTAPSTTNGIPDTTLSTSPTPSMGPRAQEGNMPSNNAAAAAGGGEQPATLTSTAPAPLDHYPLCKRGEFDHCLEPGNCGGTMMRHSHHRRHH